MLQYFPHCSGSVCLFTFQGGEETRKKSEVANAGGISCIITPGPEERRARRGETEKGSGAAAQDSHQ